MLMRPLNWLFSQHTGFALLQQKVINEVQIKAKKEKAAPAGSRPDANDSDRLTVDTNGNVGPAEHNAQETEQGGNKAVARRLYRITAFKGTKR